ncbi:hypothetical protein P280DRAFT_253948 [Massarina eburnea CBS 473.64]|uniref:EGF-like domain-containing protein n=1 Tax=Massarina eburnea CBS 473.64 TaxID=1395130 RepID=A0A6A6S8D8_9PLEO|nr:hypothetical protein P280DRAFT_253948 [Massarina eburnea CBS 473.64]
MSYDPRLAAGPYGAPDDDDDNGGTRKGSVRAARERLQAANLQRQLPDRSKIIGLPQRPNQLVPQYASEPQMRPEELTPPDSRSGSAASPQWPLPNNFPSPSSSRGPPPQRPPRPMSDDLPIQQLSPDYRDSFQSDDVFSPLSAPSRPLTTSSVTSETSSLGSIPDFPVPQPPMPVAQPILRRNPSLGPPPSSRRGPSSYYTQMSYVSPIAEESETRSATIMSHHGSFASSNVMPYNDDYYMDMEDGGFRSEDEETITSYNGRDSRASDFDDNSGLMTPALLRQASLGRRTKPSLMTIKSADSFGDKKGSVKRKPAPGAEMAGAAGIGGAALVARDGIPGGGAVLFDPSSSEENSLNSIRDLSSRYGDPEKDVLSIEAGAARGAKPRPPRLDMSAVRDAEARGSLTSLPDLIRRATRLAANLDRGKTASRLSFPFWENGAPKSNHKSRSMTDMLAAFPPPGAATPNGAITPIIRDQNPKRLSKWPSTGGYDGTDSAMSERKENRRRRCCGMPLWAFVTLLIVLLFLVAAAVILPVVLVVIPKMKNATANAAQDTQGGNNGNGNNPTTAAPTATAAPQNGQCSGVITCQNGGVAILNADRSCNCVCINGFTGSTCATPGDDGCTTTSIAGTANNATMGSGIPRLIESAQNQFSIPLNSTRLLAIFSSLSLSCTAENALITFNGLASRSAKQEYAPIMGTSGTPTRSLPILEEPDEASRFLEERQAIGQPGKANAAAAATTSAAAVSSASTIIQPVSSNSTALDFARLSVLVTLQETGKLETAANAQESIQDFLTQNRAGTSKGNTVSVGTLTVDLVQLSIKFQNGTTIQATLKNT